MVVNLRAAPTAAEEPTPTETPAEESTPTATATEMAYLGSGHALAAPMLAPEPAPALAPLCAPLTTTHRVITYTYDALYRLTGAEHRSTGLTTGSTGEYYHYTYDHVGNRLSLTTQGGVVNYQYDDANRLVLSEVEGLTSALRCDRTHNVRRRGRGKIPSL